MSCLIDIQRELVVTKSHYNAFGKYSYRSSEDILTALKPLLIKFDAVLTVTDDIVFSGNFVYIKATASLSCSDKTYTSSSYARDPLEQKGMSAPQTTNSASSFAKKQALSNLFLIDDTAEVPPTKEEQLETEQAEKNAKEEERNQINEWLKTSIAHLNNAQSPGELKGLFGNFYREAKKIGQGEMDGLTKEYQKNKKRLEEKQSESV